MVEFKLVTWNCQQAFAKKRNLIFASQPDIAVIQECSKGDAEDLHLDGYLGQWFGSDTNKGLAVFAQSDLTIVPIAQPDHNIIVAFDISGRYALRLIAVWSHVGKTGVSYVDRIQNAFNAHPEWFDSNPTIVAGDFNSSIFWDTAPSGKHATLVQHLETKDLFSAYHAFNSLPQGSEQHPTLHLYRHRDKPYHIDYVFVSSELLEKLADCQVGDKEVWLEHSDHCPIFLSIAI